MCESEVLGTGEGRRSGPGVLTLSLLANCRIYGTGDNSEDWWPKAAWAGVGAGPYVKGSNTSVAGLNYSS